MVSVEPSRRISPSRVSSPATVRSRPTHSAAKKALLPKRWASSSCRAPRRRLMRLLAPMPRPKPKAWMIDMSENTTPTAAAALVPIWETK